jgi:hypothetical protein
MKGAGGGGRGRICHKSDQEVSTGFPGGLGGVGQVASFGGKGRGGGGGGGSDNWPAWVKNSENEHQ